jgi:polyphosphate kinase
VVARARAGGRPRRLRVPEPEDPREDDARRAARGRRAAPLRPRRHRQLPRATARLYEDFGLFTADAEIAADVADLFNLLTGFGRPQRFRKLLVAPFDLRERLIEEIRGRTAAAPGRRRGSGSRSTTSPTRRSSTSSTGVAEGRRGRDRRAQHLHAAPGVEGLSENIRVRSVLGRFLEHSRVFVFEAGDVRATTSAAPI